MYTYTHIYIYTLIIHTTYAYVYRCICIYICKYTYAYTYIHKSIVSRLPHHARNLDTQEQRLDCTYDQEQLLGCVAIPKTMSSNSLLGCVFSRFWAIVYRTVGADHWATAMACLGHACWAWIEWERHFFRSSL